MDIQDTGIWPPQGTTGRPLTEAIHAFANRDNPSLEEILEFHILCPTRSGSYRWVMENPIVVDRETFARVCAGSCSKHLHHLTNPEHLEADIWPEHLPWLVEINWAKDDEAYKTENYATYTFVLDEALSALLSVADCPHPVLLRAKRPGLYICKVCRRPVDLATQSPAS